MQYRVKRFKTDALRVQMEHRRVTIAEAAVALGFSKAHTSKLFRNLKDFPDDRYERWWRFCVDALGVAPDMVSEVVGPCRCCGLFPPRRGDAQREGRCAA